MRAGRLDRRITIQRRTLTQSDSGEPIESWALVDSLRRPASMIPVRGDERYAAPSLASQEQIEFRVRWSDSVADLSPLDRVIYPALAVVSAAPTQRAIHDIVAVHEIGRREGLQIIAFQRPDVLEVETTPPATGTWALDFSIAENSGYLALLEDI